MKTFMMIDLFAGLGGASQPMKDHGWEVVRVDLDPKFEPDILCDISDFTWQGKRPDLLWSSPPCDEFAKDSMPWLWTGKTPDLSLALKTLQIVEKIDPVYWVVENVKGAIKWFAPYMGKPSLMAHPFFFWGFFPQIVLRDRVFPHKEHFSSRDKAKRAKIPYQISNAFRLAIEQQDRLL